MTNDSKTTDQGEAINKALDNYEEPESLAEATTAALDDDAIGGHATEEDVKK